MTEEEILKLEEKLNAKYADAGLGNFKCWWQTDWWDILFHAHMPIPADGTVHTCVVLFKDSDVECGYGIAKDKPEITFERICMTMDKHLEQRGLTHDQA